MSATATVSGKEIDERAEKDAKELVEKMLKGQKDQPEQTEKAMTSDMVGAAVLNLTDKSQAQKHYQNKQVSKEFLNDVYRRMAGKPTTSKAMSEDTDTAGGYKVPVEFESVLLTELPDETPLRNRVNRRQNRGNPTNIQVKTARPSWNWIAENAAITKSDPVYARVQVTKYKGAILTYSSRELDDKQGMDGSQTEELFRDLVIQAAEAEENFIISGSGSSQPTGISSEFKASGSKLEVVSAANTLNTITLDNMDALFRSVPAKYRSRALFYMRDDAVGILRKIATGTTGEHQWSDTFERTARPGAPGQEGWFMDRPVFATDDLLKTNYTIGSTVTASKAGAILFMDPEAYFVRENPNTYLDATIVGGTAWDNFQISWRLVKEVGGNFNTAYNQIAVLAYRATS